MSPRVWRRFMPKVARTAGCWLWKGATSSGYGQLRIGDRAHYAHRLSYEHYVAAIPPGLQIDHLCRTRPCVNPAHLEPVTSRENTRRGEPAMRTHCPRGHAYDVANTYRRDNGQRVCRACHRDRQRERKRRQRIGQVAS